MRPLQARLAATCETAKTTRCRCRCGGTLHGAGRFATEDEARQLDEQDPHHAAPDATDAKLRAELHRAADAIPVRFPDIDDQPALFGLEDHEI